MPPPTRALARATLVALCLSAGPLACTPDYHDQQASWEPPTASNERVERMFEQAEASPPDGLLPD